MDAHRMKANSRAQMNVRKGLCWNPARSIWKESGLKNALGPSVINDTCGQHGEAGCRDIVKKVSAKKDSGATEVEVIGFSLRDGKRHY